MHVPGKLLAWCSRPGAAVLLTESLKDAQADDAAQRPDQRAEDLRKKDRTKSRSCSPKSGSHAKRSRCMAPKSA